MTIDFTLVDPTEIIDRPNLSEDALKDLAERLYDECIACEDSKRHLVDRWDDHEHMYQADEDAASSEVVEGYGGYSLSLWKPVADRIINHVWSGMFSQRPVVQCIDMSGNGENVSALERTLDNLADHCGVELPYKRAMRNACNTNLGTVAIELDIDKKGTIKGLVASNKSPQRIFAYPVEAVTYEDAKTVGYEIGRAHV